MFKRILRLISPSVNQPGISNIREFPVGRARSAEELESRLVINNRPAEESRQLLINNEIADVYTEEQFAQLRRYWRARGRRL